MKKFLLFIFIFCLIPSIGYAQREEILITLSKSFENAKEALDYTVLAVEDMTEAYKDLGGNNGTRLIARIKSNLTKALTIAEVSTNETEKVIECAIQIACIPLKNSTEEANSSLGNAQNALEDAIKYINEAKSAVEVDAMDTNLKQAVPSIEAAIKDINTALDLLNGAAYELNNCIKAHSEETITD